MGPFLWHAPNYTLLPNVLIVSRLPCSPSASVFSAGVMFRCLLQGLPKLIQIPAAKAKANGVIVCSLYVQKEPRVLIAFLHPPSTSFPSGQWHRLKAKDSYDSVIFLMGKIDIANLQYVAASWNLPRNHSWGQRVDELQEHVLHERNNQGLRLPRLLGHLGSE